MALSTEDAAELASLKAARTALLSGKLPSSVIYNGQRTDFAAIPEGRLEARIGALEAMDASSSSRRRGSVRFRL